MKLQLTDVRTIRDAQLEIGSGVTLLAGRNRAGKSTVCRALAACAAAVPAPYTGIATRDAPRLIRRGARKATACLTFADGSSRTVTWSGTLAEITQHTGPGAALAQAEMLRSSRVAVGIDRWSTMTSEQRVLAMASACHAQPSEEDLRDELIRLGMPNDEAMSIVERTVNIGWDAAARAMDDRAKELRAEWRAATKVSWPRSDPLEWRPTGWEDDLATATRDSLAMDVVAAERQRDEAIRSTATVDETELKRLRALAGEGGSTLNAKLAGASLAVATEVERLRTLERRVEELRRAAKGEAEACPHCGRLLMILDGRIIADDPASRPSLDVVAKAAAEIETVKQHLAEARDRHEALQRFAAEVDAAVRQVARLRQLQAEARTNKASVTVDEADRALSRARDRLAAWDAHQAAQSLARNVALCVACRDVLAPDGLRKQRLSVALVRVNGLLAALSQPLEIAAVQIDSDMSVSMGAYPYEFLSASEQWLTDTLIQLALASSEMAPLVIIDGADIVREDLSQRLLGGVLPRVANQMRLVVAAAFWQPKRTPDLAAFHLGRTMWIDAEKGILPLASVP